MKSGCVAALCRLCKPSGKDQQRVGEVKPFEEEDEETKILGETWLHLATFGYHGQACSKLL